MPFALQKHNKGKEGTVIKVVNILKDGTVCDDMSKVTVPREITERVYMVLHGEGSERKRKSGKGKRADTYNF